MTSQSPVSGRMASLRTVIVLILVLALAGTVPGLKWTTVPDDIVYACAGSSVTFPWQFKVQESESVVNINWEHDGALTSAIVATLTAGYFAAPQGYASRVRHIGNGGLLLGNVSEADSGNYTVKVNTRRAGEFRPFLHTVFLQVADGLMVSGHQLKVKQMSEVSWDEVNHQWLLQLTCGHFTFMGLPPLNVTWTTPDGQNVSSTDYQSGVFSLALPTPATGGRYTCSVPPANVPTLCAVRAQPGPTPFPLHHLVQRLSASLVVDEVKARLSLLEANQRTLREENARLATNQTSLWREAEELRTNQSNLQREREELQGMVQQLQKTHAEDVRNVSEYCHGLNDSMAEDVAELWRALQSGVQTPNRPSPSGPCDPRNHTVTDDPRRLVAGVYAGGNDLCDKDLTAGWYRFMLNGTNAVIPTQCVPIKNCHTDAPTWIDLRGQEVPAEHQQVEAWACSHWRKTCCNWRSDAIVRNCSTFLIYYLHPLSTCDLSFCLTPQPV